VNLAKEGVSSRSLAERMKLELDDLRASYEGLKEQWDELYQEAREFLIAVALAPQKVKAFVNNVIIQAERDREAYKLHNELERREKRSRRHDK